MLIFENDPSGGAELSSLFLFDPARASPLAWAAILCLALYLLGVILLRRRRRRWPLGHTASFALGCTIWFAATGLNINARADELVSALLFQQITLMVAVPPLLLMGAPGRLLLKATPRVGLGRVVLRGALSGYRSRGARILLHPIIAIAVAALAFPALYFSDAVSWFLALPNGHLLLLALFLGLGIIAAAPLWSLDPLPRTPSYVVRLVDVAIEIQIHAVFGLMLLLSREPMFRWYADEPEAWGISRALDQAIGGGLVWSYGELPLIIVLIVTLSKWRKSDLRRAKQRQSQEDVELDAYNKYLAQRGEAAHRS